MLRLRGLPFTSTQEDVQLGFFEGYGAKAVSLLVGRSGKPTGEAYVEFESVEEAARAMKERQHEHLGSRYIEIFDAPEAKAVAQAVAAGSCAVPSPSAIAGSTSGSDGEDVGDGKSEGNEETAPAAQAPPAFSLSGHVLRLRGLPFSSAAQDVLDFMSGLAVVGGEAGVLFTCTPDGRPTGEAYLELATEEEAAAALGRDKERIGSRYIEVFPSSKADLLHAVQQFGFFTAVKGRRQHHWQGVHSAGGGGGERVDVHARAAAGIDDMAAAFAGFGLSQRDMQVPGPPRYGSSLGYSYGSSPPGMPPQHHGAMPAQAAWRQPLPMAMQVPGGGGMRARGGGSDGHFNPAPGPPSKPSHMGGSGAAGQPGGTLYDYTGQPAAIMVNPFMMQHPFMVAAPAPGQPAQGGAWAPASMVTAQQAGAWYAAAPPPPAAASRGGMQMVSPYTYAGGYAYAAQPPPPSSGMPGRRAPGPPASSRPRQSGQDHPPAHAPMPSPVPLEQTSSSAGDTAHVSSDENSGPLQQQGATTAAQQQQQQQTSPAPDKVLAHNDSGGGGAGGDDKQVLAVQ